MALNIAAMQQPVNVVDQFLEGRALRQAEDMRTQQMTALQNAEGRAVSQDIREQGRYEDEKKANQIKFDEITGKKILGRAQQVMALPKDQRKAYIQQNEPEYVAEFEKQRGESWADIDDDEIEEQGNFLIRKISGDLGLSPEVYKAQSDPGRIAADVKGKLLTQAQGDAILNAEKYTPIQEGTIDGKPSVYQVGERTGQKRVIEGVTPIEKKPLVSIDQRTDSASNKAYGESEGKAYSDFLQRGQDAQDKSQSLRALLANPAKTGPTQNIRAQANAFFKDIGVPIAQSKIDQIADLGGYQSAVNQLVLTELMKQKGTQTDRDTQRVQDTLPQTKNIKEANELIIKYQLALTDREALLADKAEEYRERTGKIDGWRKELRSYVRDTPLVEKDPDSGRLVFWNEFMQVMKEANPEANEEEIQSLWRERYGRTSKSVR